MTAKHPRFITIEGVDGAGKSSHVENICAQIRNAGYRVVLTREPGGCSLGEKLRQLLLNEPMDPLAETMLMFAARQEHLQQVILPALERGDFVVCDRFSDSSWAYQHSGKGVAKDALQNLEDMVCKGIRPGLTFLFDLPVEVSLERLKKTGKIPDKFESAGPDFFANVRQGYHERAAADSRFKIIDSTRSLDECSASVKDALAAYLDACSCDKKRVPHR